MTFGEAAIHLAFVAVCVLAGAWWLPAILYGWCVALVLGVWAWESGRDAWDQRRARGWLADPTARRPRCLR